MQINSALTVRQNLSYFVGIGGQGGLGGAGGVLGEDGTRGHSGAILMR